MKTEYGSVIEVSSINVGTDFAADAIVGATTIFLQDVSMFDEMGGLMAVVQSNGYDSDTYLYTAVNLVANTLTLQSGLVLAATAGDAPDRAELWPPAPERTAFVKFGIEDAEAVPVTIPHYFSGLPDGVRSSNDQENVLVEERRPGELYIKDVMNKGMLLLLPGDDIDGFTAHGTFVQLHSVDAIVSLHYPVAYAGMLEVMATRPSGVMIQRYTAYRNPQRIGTSSWTRSFAGGVWSEWIALIDDTGWISSAGTIGVMEPNWGYTTLFLRRIGSIVSIAFQVTYTGTPIALNGGSTGNIGNDTIIRMAAAYRPGGSFSQGGLCTVSTGRGATFSITFDGYVSITTATGTSDIATNEVFTIGGQYLMDLP